MEVVFSLLTFLNPAYADDTTFFLRNEKSATEVIKTFDKFSLFSGLKINNAKCEIAGIVAKKRLDETLWNGLY